MRRSPIIARMVAVYSALWLSTVPAWAGHGGPDAGSLQDSLNTLCVALNMTSCPQLPTPTQLIPETAGLPTSPPEVVPFKNSLPPTAAVNAINPPPFNLPPDVSKVTPLAFISPTTSEGAATATQPGNAAANSFFSAA